MEMFFGDFWVVDLFLAFDYEMKYANPKPDYADTNLKPDYAVMTC